LLTDQTFAKILDSFGPPNASLQLLPEAGAQRRL